MTLSTLACEGVALVHAGNVLAGRYELMQRIASGGMGEVWRAFDQVLGRTIAVKRLLTAPSDEPSFVDRFRAEARTMATISHPGVVEVYDFGDDPAAGMYLVMKYVDGESLAHTLARVGQLSAEVTMRLVAEAAEALQAAHDKGVTHRDVKPGNLLVRPDGTALLTDFGIARSTATTGHSVTGSLIGTAGYFAPERASGQPATARSDLYSLGVVAYQCLAGRLPFTGDSLVEVALRHVHDEPPPLPAHLPPRVQEVVRRAMAKDPADRWPSAAVMAAHARHALRPEPIGRQAVAPNPPRPPAEPVPGLAQGAGEEQPIPAPRGTRRLLLPAVAMAVALAVTVGIVLNRGDDPQSQALTESTASAGGGAGVTASPGATNPVSSPGTANPSPGPAATKTQAGIGTAPGTPQNPTATPTLPGSGPAAPTNLRATPANPNTVNLQWTDRSADEDGFTITDGSTSHNVGANITGYDWNGFNPGTYVCFKVRAYHSSGVSAYYPPAQGICITTPET